LSYLKQLPIDALKINRGFVRELGKTRAGAAMVTAIIDLAHGLGLSAIAEGVETPEQLRFLRDRGCDELQGYLVGPPLPARPSPRLAPAPRPLVPRKVGAGRGGGGGLIPRTVAWKGGWVGGPEGDRPQGATEPRLGRAERSTAATGFCTMRGERIMIPSATNP